MTVILVLSVVGYLIYKDWKSSTTPTKNNRPSTNNKPAGRYQTSWRTDKKRTH